MFLWCVASWPWYKKLFDFALTCISSANWLGLSCLSRMIFFRDSSFFVVVLRGYDNHFKFFCIFSCVLELIFRFLIWLLAILVSICPSWIFIFTAISMVIINSFYILTLIHFFVRVSCVTSTFASWILTIICFYVLFRFFFRTISIFQNRATISYNLVAVFGTWVIEEEIFFCIEYLY